MNSAKFANMVMEFVTDFSAFDKRFTFAFPVVEENEVPGEDDALWVGVRTTNQ
jgi:hypothetical protein